MHSRLTTAWVISAFPFGLGEPTGDCRCGACAVVHVNARRVDQETGEIQRRYAAMCTSCADRIRRGAGDVPEPPKEDHDHHTSPARPA